MSECLSLTEEFRHLSDGHANHEDKLQVMIQALQYGQYSPEYVHCICIAQSSELLSLLAFMYVGSIHGMGSVKHVCRVIEGDSTARVRTAALSKWCL